MADLPDETVMHTPGPWCVEACTGEYYHDVCLVNSPKGEGSPYTLAFCHSDDPEEGRVHISAEQAEANARLIAAAPDLLALCKEMRVWLEPEVVKEPDRSFFWKLVYVIRDAEGRS